MQIVFATHNPKKLAEIRAIAPPTVGIISLDEVGCREDIDETGSTFRENAYIKSKYVFDHYHLPCFSDDSGLEVEALAGKPGVHSARYAGEPRSDEANMNRLLKDLSGIKAREARFVTVICLYDGHATHYFEGELKGRIIHEKRGSNGFGYDPVFVPEGLDQTLAEISADEKNRISHRASASAQLIRFLDK
jgi:XTP/dITP diphosphohydrolase